MGWDLPTLDDIGNDAANATGTGAGSKWGQATGTASGDSSNPFENGINRLADAMTQISTWGLVNYDHGKLGLQGHTMDFANDLTGKNANRKAAMDRNQAFQDEQARQAQLNIDAQARQQNQDTQASQMAGSLRTAASSQQRSQLGFSSGYDPSKDFLGL